MTLDGPVPYEPPVVLARAAAAGGGELVLRRRLGNESRSAVDELVVDGVFAMDTVDSSTEVRLASESLARVSGDRLTVVVGGLGLGFTLRAVLADPRVARVVVVELEPALVDWMRAGLIPSGAGLLDEPRVEVVVADLAAWLERAAPGSADAVLLDVDNGPEFLVHQTNSGLYETDSLQQALRAVRTGGVLSVWSADRSDILHARLSRVSGAVEELRLPLTREGRSFDYAIYLARP